MLPVLKANILIYFAVIRFLTNNSVVAVIGTQDSLLEMATQELDIPFIVTSLGVRSRRGNTFHLLPETTDVATAIMDIVHKYDWKKMAIIYDDMLGKTHSFD